MGRVPRRVKGARLGGGGHLPSVVRLKRKNSSVSPPCSSLAGTTLFPALCANVTVLQLFGCTRVFICQADGG